MAYIASVIAVNHVAHFGIAGIARDSSANASVDLHTPINIGVLATSGSWAAGVAAQPGGTGVDTEIHIANLIIARIRLENGADSAAAPGGVVVGIIADKSHLAFGSKIDAVMLDQAGVSCALVEGFTRGKAVMVCDKEHIGK